MLEVQYTSDLHINDFPKGTPFESFVTPVAPILVIAGDICSVWNPIYSFFLRWCSRNWHTVIFVTGNHEYYSEPERPKTFLQTEYEIHRIVHDLPNVHYLQSGSSFHIAGIHFVGATLWSAIDPEIWREIETKKGDYLATYMNAAFGIRNTHPSDICALHALHKAYLRSAIVERNEVEMLVVVTHHMPTLRLLEEHYKTDKLKSCYASPDDDLLYGPNVWICGHSHRATQLRIPNGPLIVMNSRGYNRHAELTRTLDIYNPTAKVALRGRR